MLVEKPVSFESHGATLRGYLIAKADGQHKCPGVVMAHGTSATVQMVAIEYARVFARAGLAVIIYDHRGFGRSGGEPRLEINPWVQCRGYLDALSFAASLPEVDANRIALWGDSYTGGQVVVVAACDSRPKAIVAQCPVFGATVPELQPSNERLEAIRTTLLTGDVSGTPESTTGQLPVVSADQVGTPSLLAPIQAFRWFIDYGGRPGSGWVNRVTRVLPPTPVPYNPFFCTPYVKAKTLFMVAPQDEMIHANYQVARRAFNLIPAHKEWHDIANGHFGLIYYPGAQFDEVSAMQAAFLCTQLDA